MLNRQGLFRIISLGLILSFTTSVGAQGLNLEQSPDWQSNVRRPPNVSGPTIQINPPSSENFFNRSRKVFPSSFQAGGSMETKPESAGILPEYPVGPGDKFLISFWGKIEDRIVVAIDSASKLFIPRLGTIDTKGLNYAEFESLVAQKINASLKDVKFTLSLVEPRKFKIYALGSVHSPGPLFIEATYRASDAVAMAGGPTATGTSQFIQIRRGDKVLRVDLMRFMAYGDFSMNPFLTDGDVLFVPDLGDFATITGAVVRPGTFELKEEKKLNNIIQFMGGLSVYADQTAPIRLSRLTARGDRETYFIYTTSEAVKSKRDLLLADVILKHGDEVFVPAGQLLIPSKANMVFVTGEVKNPGAKPYQISMSVEEYIGISGGLSNRANLASAVIYRADGSTVALRPRINVEPGDTIYIPERTFKFWQDHLVIITTFLSLATTVIAVTR